MVRINKQIIKFEIASYKVSKQKGSCLFEQDATM